MSLSLVGSTNSVYAANATSISANMPSGMADGDALFAFLSTRKTITVPDGWDLIATTQVMEWDRLTYTLRKLSVTSGDSGQSQTFEFTAASVTAEVAYLAVRASVDEVLVVASAEEEAGGVIGGENGTTVAATEFIASVDGSLVIGASMWSGAGEISAPADWTLTSGTHANNRLGVAYIALDTSESSGADAVWTGPSSFLRAAVSLHLADAVLTEVTADITIASPVAERPRMMSSPLASPVGTLLASIECTPASVASLSSPVGSFLATIVHDFSGVIGQASTYYAMEFTGDPVVRIPISSWQCTYRANQKTYLQAVIPAVYAWIDTIADRRDLEEFVIIRGAALPDGSIIEYEMARAPIQVPAFNRGPRRWTCTLRGYAAAFVPGPAELYGDARVLTKIRSLSIVDNLRVRCAIDWLLRPGGLATADGQTFRVDYINYLVGSNDAYMDVGAAAEEA